MILRRTQQRLSCTNCSHWWQQLKLHNKGVEWMFYLKGVKSATPWAKAISAAWRCWPLRGHWPSPWKKRLVVTTGPLEKEQRAELLYVWINWKQQQQQKHVVGLAKRCFLCLKGQQSPLPCTSGQRQVHEGMVEQEFSAELTVTSTLQITFGKN